MRADKITQVAQSAEGKARDVHHRKRRGARFRHPRGQQDSATVRAVHYKMDHARMNKTPNRHDPPSGERMMRIFNDDIDEVFLGSMSLVRPASAKAGWPAPSARKPAATIAPSSIIAGRSSARTWRSPEAMCAIRASSNPLVAPICSFSTTSASNPSTPVPVMICSKSSKSDTPADRRSSPPSSRCPPGMKSLAIPPTPTPSWTAWSTTRIVSS